MPNNTSVHPIRHIIPYQAITKKGYSCKQHTTSLFMTYVAIYLQEYPYKGSNTVIKLYPEPSFPLQL